MHKISIILPCLNELENLKVLVKEITKICKRKDIMHVRYFIFEEEDRSWENQRRVGSSMSMIMRDYCNFDKQIKNDVITGYLVCEFKDNR